MLEHEAKAFLKEMGLPVPRGTFFKTGSVPSSAGMTYPLAAKVSSEQIISKSDVRGIRTGITNEEELKQAVAGLMEIPGAEGVLVEEMAPRGVEVIIGGIIDPQFGPVMMFGLGGVYVELFKDVAFGLAPLEERDALWLIAQIKGRMLLEGYRGGPPVGHQCARRHYNYHLQADDRGPYKRNRLKPVAAYPAGAMILDAKMSLI